MLLLGTNDRKNSLRSYRKKRSEQKHKTGSRKRKSRHNVFKLIFSVMKKFMFMLLLTGVAVGLTSCGGVFTVSKIMPIKTRDIIGVGVVHIPTVVDLDVLPKKVTATYEMTVVDNKQTLEQQEENAKNLAVSQLLTKANADIIVEPRYLIERVSDWGSIVIKVTVSGYPATYENFRPMTAKDTTLLRVNPLHLVK
jgi:hypothetical protein